MPSTRNGGGITNFTPYSRYNACPVCGRVKDEDCRISPELVFCHKNTDHKVGDVIDCWAFTGVANNGRTGKFIPHNPLEKHPETLYGSSEIQRSKRYYKNGKKLFAVQHLVGEGWAPGVWDQPWQLFFEKEALEGLGDLDSDGYVWEFEGEKCSQARTAGAALSAA